MENNIQFWSYLAHFFLEWKMYQAKVVEKIETRIWYSITFSFSEKSAVGEIMWKNIAELDRDTDDNMVHAHCILKPSATDTHWIANTFPL